MPNVRVPEPDDRRPIPERGAHWVLATACRLQRAGVQPNQVSVMGLICAAVAAVCLILAGRSDDGTRAALLVVAAATIPLRMLCNVLDGMLAVEFDLKTASGAIYNEIPDRLSDLLLLVGAGYAIAGVAWAPQLGWAAAATALLTAYVRILGVALGAGWHFEGPMAKPRRMYVLIAACLLSAVATALGWREAGWPLAAALVVIIAGGMATVLIRLRHILADLDAV